MKDNFNNISNVEGHSCLIVIENIIILRVSSCSDIWYCNILAYYLDNWTLSIIMILMWSCPGTMPKYYPGLRDILPNWTQQQDHIII